MPRGIPNRKKHVIESNEVFEGSEKTVDIGKLAKGEHDKLITNPEDVNKALSKHENAKFMNEELEVYLQDPMTDHESKFCFIGCQGITFWLRRGGTYRLPRKHVEVLARAKAGRVVQTRHIAPDGSQSYIDKEVLNLQYPFTVVSDPSGARGTVWLKQILQQAG